MGRIPETWSRQGGSGLGRLVEWNEFVIAGQLGGDFVTLFGLEPEHGQFFGDTDSGGGAVRAKDDVPDGGGDSVVEVGVHEVVVEVVASGPASVGAEAGVYM